MVGAAVLLREFSRVERLNGIQCPVLVVLVLNLSLQSITFTEGKGRLDLGVFSELSLDTTAENYRHAAIALGFAPGGGELASHFEVATEKLLGGANHRHFRARISAHPSHHARGLVDKLRPDSLNAFQV